MEEIRATADQDELVSLAKELQEHLANDVPAFPLLYDLHANIANKNVSGLPKPEPGVLGAITFADLYLHGVTGRVAAGHPAVVEAAAGILRAGGNAFDAAVAAGFAAAVAEPGLTSLAGGGFLLARTAAGEEVLFDFFVDTPGRGLPDDRPSPHFEAVEVRFPAAVQTFHCGLGLGRGARRAHRLPARPPPARSPAARRGGRTGGPPRRRGRRAAAPPGRDHRPPRAHPHPVPEAAAVFAPGGVLLRTGDRVRNPDLAALLAGLAAGTAGDFAGGPLARAPRRA